MDSVVFKFECFCHKRNLNLTLTTIPPAALYPDRLPSGSFLANPSRIVVIVSCSGGSLIDGFLAGERGLAQWREKVILFSAALCQ